MRRFALLMLVISLRAGGFIWPLNPFTALTSTFYEYRTTHFHSGVDLSTFGKRGLPVRASASGEIFRIFYHWYGFGRAIYIRHPGGYVTVYGHLSRFENKKLHLEDLIKRVSAKLGRKYIGNYYLEKPIAVRAGQVIGYSGSMGAGGPHLHFEIRKGELIPENPLNFLHAEEGEVVFPGYVLEVASGGSFVGLKPTRFYGRFPEKRTIPISGCFRVMVGAYEKCRGRCGPYSLEALFDGKRVFYLKADSFAFSENYRAGRIFNLSLSSPKKPFYVIPDFSSPPLCIKEGQHQLVIVGKNRKRQATAVKLKFHYLPPPTSEEFKNRCCLQIFRKGKWERVKKIPQGNFHYRFRARYQGFLSPWIVMYQGQVLEGKETLEPERIEEHIGWEKIYFPGDKLLSPLFCDGECFAVATPGKELHLVSQGFSFPVKNPREGIKIEYKGGFPGLASPRVSRIPPLKLPPDLQPISSFFLITPLEALLKIPLKVSFPLEEKEYDRKVGIYRKFFRGWTYIKPVFRKGWVSANTKLLGVFVLAKDVLPPKIGRIRITRGQVKVRIKDRGSGVNPEKIYFRVGKQKIIPEYDYDAGLAFGELHFKKGRSLLTVEAQDFAGNRASRSVWIKVK